MNLPNKITVSRILLIPIFLLVMLVPLSWGNVELLGAEMPVTHLIGALIFIIASVTDWVDGYFARKYNLVTNLGKFLDPLADKLLVSAALIVLVDLNLAPSWIVIIIISREFAVTGLRLVLAGEGEVVAANQLGKIKTWAQIVAISALLLHNIIFEMVSIRFDLIALWVAMFFTIWSGWDYFAKNKQAFINSK
ncbi:MULTISPECIES: CDP-diacylglycerol--glycerol-3-phosphate 3-phosphatidyltransferase [Bacillaceae]|jgi:CDP-diacylglycerol--glycerol-3-phosphate 3-phosphatidyltransferase|uniref:CDP-diacylglycerol--glycerol-3-phosphate 3-phosphatidyltransferase n=2 Tax=Cytobacillus firmus TaxID=1399 RepID=A0AA46SFS2_CYTFI|nr:MULTISPECIES: CDP-diacylglycerol--glycerol-3-phosphate 3-phosphatidyltransferase [Bacillaceae]EWG10440.1 CDP-diacylglycerol--glycerol-3-phosphate 3-phosphatidyltransferase [Cytobacillus firmus DS1]KML43692.1 CDP-diacylglycerol--glycerol-3-phosphate 3-phosphatidyltransferase [Cytobacillus firmus]MBG9445521.1 CDP-diacylglycerol--glycerol-3-phosphate 3-phosphatidyltransferase [Cytobacillus firmus]MBG9450361.1 CDP-diacylglycerol--glycerol-3-phosphate 3-phosphatidyltransferase [Cytobacillus firmu